MAKKKSLVSRGKIKADGWGPADPLSPQQQWEKMYEGYRTNLNSNLKGTGSLRSYTTYNTPTPKMPEGFTGPFSRTSPAKAGGGDGNPFLISKKKR